MASLWNFLKQVYPKLKPKPSTVIEFVVELIKQALQNKKDNQGNEFEAEAPQNQINTDLESVQDPTIPSLSPLPVIREAIPQTTIDIQENTGSATEPGETYIEVPDLQTPSVAVPEVIISIPNEGSITSLESSESGEKISRILKRGISLIVVFTGGVLLHFMYRRRRSQAVTAAVRVTRPGLNGVNGFKSLILPNPTGVCNGNLLAMPPFETQLLSIRHNS